MWPYQVWSCSTTTRPSGSVRLASAIAGSLRKYQPARAASSREQPPCLFLALVGQLRATETAVAADQVRQRRGELRLRQDGLFVLRRPQLLQAVPTGRQVALPQVRLPQAAQRPGAGRIDHRPLGRPVDVEAVDHL